MTDNNDFCKHHFELVSKIGNLKWLFIVILGLMVAVTGFLWGTQQEGLKLVWENQSQIRSRLETYQEGLTGRDPGREGILTRMEKNLDRMNWQLEEDARVKAVEKGLGKK